MLKKHRWRKFLRIGEEAENKCILAVYEVNTEMKGSKDKNEHESEDELNKSTHGEG